MYTQLNCITILMPESIVYHLYHYVVYCVIAIKFDRGRKIVSDIPSDTIGWISMKYALIVADNAYLNNLLLLHKAFPWPFAFCVPNVRASAVPYTENNILFRSSFRSCLFAIKVSRPIDCGPCVQAFRIWTQQIYILLLTNSDLLNWYRN